MNSDFDLNSLIEGDVDDDDFGEEFVTALEEPKADKKDGPVRVHFEPLKVSLSWGGGNLGRSCLVVLGSWRKQGTVQNRLGGPTAYTLRRPPFQFQVSQDSPGCVCV